MIRINQREWRTEWWRKWIRNLHGNGTQKYSSNLPKTGKLHLFLLPTSRLLLPSLLVVFLFYFIFFSFSQKSLTPAQPLFFFSCKPLPVPLLIVQQKGLYPQPPLCWGSGVFATRLMHLAHPWKSSSISPNEMPSSLLGG